MRSEFYAYFIRWLFGGGQRLHGHYCSAGLSLRLEIHVLLHDAAPARGYPGGHSFFRHDRPSRPIPWKELHPREMLIIATGVLMLIYVITYGKTLDWMASRRICTYIVIAPLLVGNISLGAVPLQPSFRKPEATSSSGKPFWVIST